MSQRHRLAIVATHPIQYYAPWFRTLAQHSDLTLKVFYLWDFGVTTQRDAEFDTSLQWDIPLLDGYDAEFIPNRARARGTHHFWGLRNPTLLAAVATFAPDSVLLTAYNYASTLQFVARAPRRWRLLMRGDSHRLTPRSGFKAALKRGLLTRLFARFSGFLYVGEANRRYFAEHGVRSDKLFFAPHAVDNARFTRSLATASSAAAWRLRNAATEVNRVALFVGKFEWQKDLPTLLQAFARARAAHWQLWLVGTGPLEQELRAAAGDGVKFLGFQNQSVLPDLYAAADVLVLPSISETWGLVVNEAMAAGVPAIVSDQCGCQLDLVEHGVTGWVFPAGEVSALARVLQSALADDLARATIARAAKTRIAQYDFVATSAGLLQALQA